MGRRDPIARQELSHREHRHDDGGRRPAVVVLPLDVCSLSDPR